MIRRLPRLRGFAILELLVATLCLSVMAVGILAALRFVDDANYASRQRLFARNIAETEVSRLKSLSRGAALVGGITTTALDSSCGLPLPATLTTTITPTSDTSLFDVDVTVTWTLPTSQGAITRTTHLDTALSNANVQ